MWNSIEINIQNIKLITERAVLINCPHNSEYNGYSFWHPRSLIRDGKHSYARSLSYSDDFKFILIKLGKGKFNKNDVLSKLEISVGDFENMFGVMSDNICSRKEVEIFETHKPQIIEPIKQTIHEDLLDE